MYIYKMLCLNRIREHKRLIKNMFFPLVSLALIIIWAGVQMFHAFFAAMETPERMEIKFVETAHIKIESGCGMLLLLLVFSGCRGFLKKEPVITIKPASLLWFNKNRLDHLIGIRFMGIILKHVILALCFSVFINGYFINRIVMNRDFILTSAMVFLILNTSSLLRWKIYHQDTIKRQDAGIWCLFSLSAVLVNVRPYFIGMDCVIWCFMLRYDLCVLEFNMAKYEDEMRFAEKILTAQNHNQTVLLDQYAKEKKVRNLPVRKKESKLLFKMPLVWKAGTSIYRLSKEWIVFGTGMFLLSLLINRIPVFWSMPPFEQKEVRQFLLTGSIFSAFQLSIQSMLKQLDSILEKAEEGLLIPLSNRRIVKQFIAVPVIVISGECLVMAFALGSGVLRILAGCMILACMTILIFVLEVTCKRALRKGYFMLGIVILISAWIISM